LVVGFYRKERGETKMNVTIEKEVLVQTKIAGKWEPVFHKFYGQNQQIKVRVHYIEKKKGGANKK
jgi:hypothetical protein